MYKKVFVLILSGALMLTACNMNTNISATQEVSASPKDILPPGIVAEIQNQVSQILGLTVEEIQIETVQEMDWPDGCLGLPKEGESCTEAIVHGWLLVVTVNDTEYRFRADKEGTNIRQEP